MKTKPSFAMFVALLISPVALAASVVTIDIGPVAGHPSIAIAADGLPVIAYEAASGGLRLVKCYDPGCVDGSVVDINDPPTGTTSGRYNSVAIGPDGNPAIAFYDTVDVALKLVKCITANCFVGGFEFRTIDPGPYVSIDIALAFDPDGKAVFAYQDASQQALMLARCQNTGCGNVDIEVLAPMIGGVHHGQHATIAIGENGGPVVSGRQWSTQDTALDYFVCTDAPCVGPPTPLFGAVGQPIDSPAMALTADFRPVFSYHGETDDTLMFGWCENPGCTGTRHSRVLDDGSLGAGAYSAIGVRPDGRPLVAYQKSVTVSGGGAALYVIECDDSDCASSQQIRIDQGSGQIVGVDPAIAIGADGSVQIAYYDASTSSLKFARCNPQSCEGPGDRIFTDGFE